MQASSEITPLPIPDNAFFSPAQIMAFSQAPSDKALGEVNVGGRQKEKYILGDYITLLLNMYIGQGLWDKQVELLETHDEVLKKRRKKKVNGQETGEWEDYDQLVVSATIKVSLIIYARDGSNRTRKYEAVCVGTNFTDPANGRADALDKAIKSAETDGLKRTSKNLGRAFGLDLKMKVKNDFLPPKLSHFHAQYEAAMAKLASGKPPANVESTPSGDAAATSQTEPAATGAPSPAPVTPAAGETTSTAAKPTANSGAETAPTESAAADKVTQAAKPAQTSETTTANTRPAPAPFPESAARGNETSQAPVADKPADAQKPTGDQTKPPPWDLTMVPQNYEQWRACIFEMGRRLSIMRHAQEIEAFRSRYARLIDKLPVIPATDDFPRKDFKAGWAKMVSARYEALQLPEPGKPGEEQAVAA